MKIIARPVSSGKTKELIEIAITEHIPILCDSEREAHNIIRKGLAYFGEVPMTLQYGGLKEYNGDILIDNAEKALIKFLFEYNPNISISAITLSTEN